MDTKTIGEFSDFDVSFEDKVPNIKFEDKIPNVSFEDKVPNVKFEPAIVEMQNCGNRNHNRGMFYVCISIGGGENTEMRIKVPCVLETFNTPRQIVFTFGKSYGRHYYEVRWTKAEDYWTTALVYGGAFEVRLSHDRFAAIAAQVRDFVDNTIDGLIADKKISKIKKRKYVYMTESGLLADLFAE